MTTVISRWNGAVFATLWIAAIGIVAAERIVVLAALVPLGYLLYGYVTTVETPAFSAQRTIARQQPLPGDEVCVELTVRNESDAYKPDVRIADEVPDELEVSSGSERGGFVLAPGESTTLEYVVRSRRGEHTFGDLTVRLRSVGGRYAETVEIPVTGDATIQCRESIRELPLRAQTRQYVGQADSDVGGSGTEFFATREYRRGDPVSRINWRHYARRGDLSTVEYRAERSISVTFLVDATDAARISRSEGDETGVELACYAARSAVIASLDAGHSVGLAIVDDHGLRTHVKPGGGSTTRERILHALGAETVGTEPAQPANRPTNATQGSPAEPPSTGDRVISPDGGPNGRLDGDSAATIIDHLRGTLAGDTQIVVVSPGTEEWVSAATRRFESHGHRVTVLSPDAVGRSTRGRRIEQVNRQSLLSACHRHGARVVDWEPDESLGLALRRDDR